MRMIDDDEVGLKEKTEEILDSLKTQLPCYHGYGFVQVSIGNSDISKQGLINKTRLKTWNNNMSIVSGSSEVVC